MLLMKSFHLITPFIRALMCWACLFFAGQAWATVCHTSAKITLGRGGATALSAAVTATTGTLTNYWLEVNIESYLGNLNNGSATSDYVKGDFCSFSYAKNFQTHWGTLLGQLPKWTVLYGVTSITIPGGCVGGTYQFTSLPPANSPSPFIDGWLLFDGTAMRQDLTEATAVWAVSANTACTGTKFYIPLTINYDLGTSNSITIDSVSLFKNVAFCCGNGTKSVGSYSATGATFEVRTVKSSCALSAPTLSLGTYSTNSLIHTNGVLGGVLKSTDITLTCNSLGNVANITPNITITDAGAPTNKNCIPANIASTPAPAQIALFNSNKIVFDFASRYCVAPSTDAPNTIKFPAIAANTTAYKQSIPIYAGIYSATQPVRKPGALLSVLQLTVSYQ
jgi:hypothetical protein